jgi:hypothetical protein
MLLRQIILLFVPQTSSTRQKRLFLLQKCEMACFLEGDPAEYAESAEGDPAEYAEYAESAGKVIQTSYYDTLRGF